jgi:hypothetical protein
MRTSRVLVLALLAVLALPVAGASATSGLPTEKHWLADVSAAMAGSQSYLKNRAASAGPNEHLAVNLDIDNTSLATRYSPGQAIAVVLRFTRYAHNHGIAVLFNTGRSPQEGAAAVRRQLVRAGYTVDGFCHRNKGERVAPGKQRCRASFVATGYTIVANVGNRSTDFSGGNYERAFMLPNYGNKLS